MNATERIRPVPLPGKRLALTLAYAALRRVMRKLYDAHANPAMRTARRRSECKAAAGIVSDMLDEITRELDGFDPNL